MPGPSLSILAVLFVLVVAAGGAFWMLTRRWVHGRQMGALYDWARDNSMSLDRRGEQALPEVFEHLPEQPRALLTLHDQSTMIAQLRTDPRGSLLQPQIWNVFVRRLPVRWPATALRPAAAVQIYLDFFALPAIAGLPVPERLTIHGEDGAAAARLAASPLGAMLPPGIGLLLMGDYLVLDFSNRPFDGTEFTRMSVVADQIIAQLPKDPTTD